MYNIYKPKLFSFILLYMLLIILYPAIVCKSASLSLSFIILVSLSLPIIFLLYILYKKYASYHLQLTDKGIILKKGHFEHFTAFSECKIFEGFLICANRIIFIGYSNGIYGNVFIKEIKQKVNYTDVLSFKENFWLIKKVGWSHPFYIVLLSLLYGSLVIFWCA